MNEQVRSNRLASYKREFDQEYERELQWISRAQELKEPFVPGAILYTSWGYNQTNIDFYVITGRKNDTVTIQEIGAKETPYNSLSHSGTCVPDEAKKIGVPFKRRFTKYGYLQYDSTATFHLYKGNPKYYSSTH